MTRIGAFLCLSMATLSGLWLLAEPSWPQPPSFYAVRPLLMQYSGAVAIGAMSLAMMLALRPRWLERLLDGMDKIYRLHKWLGIVALAASAMHVWCVRGAAWMQAWGWVDRPAPGRRLRPPDGTLQAWMTGQRAIAEELGTWAFYATTVLIVLALVRRFPYHLFARTHRWIAVAYLMSVAHSLVLVRFAYWHQPIGWMLAALMLGGSASAVLVLAGRVGAGRKVGGMIESVIEYPGLEVLETRIALRAGWPGHAAGQFAFVTTDPRDGAHPYTIASAWNAHDRRITFITKALGDHTRRLREQLRPGQPVTVEGPYGRFTFEDSLPRQVWIGAGIGITPFIARMKQLAREPGDKAIDLFHPTKVHDATAVAKLEADARAAGVRLHVLVDAKDGLLDADQIRARVPDWASGSVWFCGPTRFGRRLKADLRQRGLSARHFHQELFEMR